MHHALEAKDWEKALKVFGENSTNYMNKGMWVTLLNWLQRMPEAVIYNNTRLSHTYGVLFYMTDQLEGVASVANRMEQMHRKDDVIHQGAIACLRGLIAFSRGDYDLCLEFNKKALSLFPSDESLLRAHPSSIVGKIYWQQKGMLKEAEAMINEAYKLSQLVGQHFLSGRTLYALADISTLRGKLHLAARQHRQSIEQLGTSPATGISFEYLGAIFYEWNQIDTAIAHVQEAIRLMRITGDKERLAKGNAMLARYKLIKGDEVEAAKNMEIACAMAHDNIWASIRAEHAVFHILMAIRLDDLAAILEWGKKFAEDTGALPFYFNWVPIRLLIAEGKKPEALEKLQNLYQESFQRGAQSNLIHLRVCQTMAADNEESALKFLSEALTMAEPEGYIRTFVDEGRLLKPLLEKALSQGITPEYTRKLLSVIEAEERQRRATKGRGMPVPSTTEFLSERELEVLRLVTDGLSNQQIADRLVISLNTAKTHVHRLFGKLNAKDRLQVVTRAKQLKLI